MTTIVSMPAAPYARGPVTRRWDARRLWARVNRRVYLPACSIALVAAVLIGVGWSNHWGGAAFGPSVTTLRVVILGPLSAAVIAVLMAVERLWPAQQRPILARGHRHDMLLTLLNVLVVAPLVTALTLSFVEVLRHAAPWVVLPKTGVLPRWGAIVLIVLAMDCCNWLAHYANHRVAVLWRFHELHHSQEDMNVLTVFRTHPLIHVSYLIALVPGVVLLANGALSTTVLVAYGGIVAFAHSNTRTGFGWLGRVIVSPNYHRIHHQLDGPQDVNLGFALTIWDQLFRRAVFPTTATVRIDTGLPGRPLTVEQAGARAHHFSVLARQLVAPFRSAEHFSTSPSVRSDAGQGGGSADRAVSGARW
jgi:sterol desaturase/sphingolipid hydroxylase (fatty acid hydroxylase superfamily)